jgi:hypothetical protein
MYVRLVTHDEFEVVEGALGESRWLRTFRRREEIEAAKNRAFFRWLVKLIDAAPRRNRDNTQ